MPNTPYSTSLNSWRARAWRGVEAHPNLLILALVTLLAPFALSLVWLKMHQWEQRQIRAELLRVGQVMDLRLQRATLDFRYLLDGLGDLSDFVATDLRLTVALEQPDKPAALQLASSYMDQVSDKFGVNLLMLVNTDGRVLVSRVPPGSASLTGQEFSDREYFKSAMAGKSGRQFAVGRSTNIPGLFFSHPVRTQTGQLLGAAVIKMDLADIARRIELEGVIVVDAQGVVILARQADLVFRSIEGAPILNSSDEFRLSRYKRTHFPVLKFQTGNLPDHPEVQLFGEPPRAILHRQFDMPEHGISVHLVEDLTYLSGLRARHQHVLWITWLGALAFLWAVSATIVFLMRGHCFRLNIEAVNVELHKLNEQLKHQAEVDFLTGCMNRRRFDEELDHEIRRSLRQKYPLTLAMFDLDHFKIINDSHGHQTGDAALQHFARVVRDQIRQTDRFARLGGEEFALLMPDAGSAAALPMVERLRQRIAQTPLPLPNGELLPMSVSIGMASLCKVDDNDSLYQRADNAMYEAKAGGRNRTVCAPNPPGQQEMPGTD